MWNWADTLGQGISHTILIKLAANEIYFWAKFFPMQVPSGQMRFGGNQEQGKSLFFVFLFIRSSWNATWVRIPRPNIAARANFIITGPWAKFKIG